MTQIQESIRDSAGLFGLAKSNKVITVLVLCYLFGIRMNRYVSHCESLADIAITCICVMNIYSI